MNVTTGLALAASLSVFVVAAEPQRPQAAAAATTVSDQGLCRRTGHLAPLPPERPGEEAQIANRRTTVPAPPALVTAPAPAPVASPEPAEGAVSEEFAAEDGDTLIVTGTRIRRRDLTSSSPIASVGDEELTVTGGGRRGPDPDAGQLTAGEHDDLLNPELYAKYVAAFADGRSDQIGMPAIDTRRVLTIEVQDETGRPVPFADVSLTCADGNRLSLATVADGRAVFFPDLDRLGDSVEVRVHQAGRASSGARTVRLAGRTRPQLHTITLADGRAGVERFDLALVIDTTGSMDDEIAYLRSELRAIVGALRRNHPRLDLRIALIAYRDQGDAYVTRTFGFDGDVDVAQTRLAAQSADGGGDYPEAMDEALHRGVALDWRRDAIRSLVLVADAPPHAEKIGTAWTVAEAARARRIHITPVAASGVGDEAEYVMRAMAATTQSRYLFLTDDSGIGNAHAEPAIDCYLVTRLDALLRRVLDSQISGRRIEPGAGEIIRRVGDYNRGRCRLPRGFASAG